MDRVLPDGPGRGLDAGGRAQVVCVQHAVDRVQQRVNRQTKSVDTHRAQVEADALKKDIERLTERQKEIADMTEELIERL